MAIRILLLCFLFPFYLGGADLHLQTSADPYTGQIQVELNDKLISVNLDKPGVKIEKHADGKLKALEFVHGNLVYVVKFFHGYGISEKIAEVASYSTLNGKKVLKGPLKRFNQEGDLISEQNWMDGKLHGLQKVYDTYGFLRQEGKFAFGYPVGIWKNYYFDGSVATEIHFPENVSKWQETEKPPRGDADESTLRGFVQIKPIEAKEIWYSLKGFKQREVDLRLYKKGSYFYIEKAGNFKTFDFEGNVIGKQENSGVFQIHSRKNKGRFALSEFQIGQSIFKTASGF